MKSLITQGLFSLVFCLAQPGNAQPLALVEGRTPAPHRQWAGNLRSSSSTATGVSNSFNPAISVNGLILGFYTSDPLARGGAFDDILGHTDEGHGHEQEHEEEEEHEDEESQDGDSDSHVDEASGEHGHAPGLPEDSGLSIQEVEVRFTAVVDAYFSGDLTLAIPGTKGLEVEEAVLTTTGLRNITVKAGKFYVDFGKHNRLHTHAFPLIDPPLANQRLLGGEGFNEVGIGVSYLIPLSWYSNLTLQILNGDQALFNSANSEDLALSSRWSSLWDLSDSATLEVGGSYATGRNLFGARSHIWGGDLTWKWEPLSGSGRRSAKFQTEFTAVQLNHGVDGERARGLNSFLEFRVKRRWWWVFRYDTFSGPESSLGREQEFSSAVVFAPTEFSALRIQYDRNTLAGQSVNQIALQLNFTMGAHPGHSY